MLTDILNKKVELIKLARKYWVIMSDDKPSHGYYRRTTFRNTCHDVDVYTYEQRYCMGRKKGQLNYIRVYFPQISKTATKSDIVTMISSIKKLKEYQP